NGFATKFTAIVKGFTSPLWMTARQIEQHHGKILDGQKPTSIIFTGRYRRKIGGAAAPDGKTVQLPLGHAEPPRPAAPPPVPARPAEAAKDTKPAPAEKD